MAGQHYYIEAVHHEGIGGDNLGATYKLVGQADPAYNSASKLTGSVVGWPQADSGTLFIMQHPVSRTNLAGTTVTLSVAAVGTPLITYQWRKNGVDLKNAGKVSGAKSDTLTIGNVQPADAGEYQVVLTDLAGSVTSAVAVLTISVPAVLPWITAQPQSRTNAVGTVASFTVTAGGSVPLSYQWRFNGNNLIDDLHVTDANSNTLTIFDVKAENAGDYDVVVANSAGATTSAPPARLTVVVLPSVAALEVLPPSPVAEGTNVIFCVTATGTAPLTYQWRRNGLSIVGATQACYDLANVTIAHAGAYSVAVSNAAGGVISGDLALAVLPDWRTNVVGATGDGSYTLVDGVFTVNGSGEDIEGTKDDFFFVHKPLNGDGQIVARLLGLVPADPNSEAGVMLRDGTNSGARHVFLPLNKEKRVSFRRRLTENDYAVQTVGGGTNWTWLRLMRLGDTFVGHASTNGTDWSLIYWTTLLNMPTNLEAGLAVTAHRNQAMATAQFDNVGTGPLTPLPGVWPETGPRLCLGGEGGGRAEFLRVGGFKVLVGGVVGERYAIKSSAVVDAPFASWLDMGTVTNTYGVVPFTDPQALTNGMRFYRATVVSP